MRYQSLIAKTVATSAVAGMRSMSGPTMLALFPQVFGLSEETQQLLKTGVGLLGVGEMIADKLPVVPNRIWWPALMARAASGALIGAMVFRANNADVKSGAAVGAGSAVVTAYVSFYARRFLTRKMRVPDFMVATLEDAIVLAQRRYVARAGLRVLEKS